MAPTETALDAALYYASRGWYVVPVLPNEKRPALNDWVNQATIDPTTIRRWWATNPLYGVGIVTGERSGIWAVDVDPRDGGDDSLADLEAAHTKLPDTIESITGSNGRHLIFKWPGFNPGTNAGQLGPGLDIRGEGGFIVAPPTIHPNGRKYVWEIEHDPHDGLPPLDAPAWLLDALRPQELPIIPLLPSGTTRHGDDHLPTWETMLTDTGAKYGGARTNRKTGTPYQLWIRPGKDTGTSATLNYSGLMNLKIHTSNWPQFAAGDSVSQFRYYSTMYHDGDDSKARQALHQAQEQSDLNWLDLPATVVTEVTTEQVTTAPDSARIKIIDWPTFWKQDHSDEQWVIDPIIAKGRGHALYAPAKAGKSTLILAIAAAAATGTSILGRPPAPPRRILYCDYEMTADDLHERLEELGYSEHSDLSNLKYALLPDLAPLDTFEGGQQLLALATTHNVECVVIDTFGRAVQGEENTADTTRHFYRLTGNPLKAAGIAWVRTDHSGKDKEKGQRGSSAKNDDVDVVWRLDRNDKGLRLARTHARMSWVPERLDIARIELNDGRIVYKITNEQTYLPGTKELAETLDRLGVPVHAGRPTVRREYDIGKIKNNLLADAIRWRKAQAHNAADLLANDENTVVGDRGQPRGQRETENLGQVKGQHPDNALTRGDSAGDSAGQFPKAVGDSPPYLKGDSSPPCPQTNEIQPQLTAEDLI